MKHKFRRLPMKLRSIVQGALDLECRLVPGGKHPRLETPTGRLLGIVSFSPSDWRCQLNSASQIKQALNQACVRCDRPTDEGDRSDVLGLCIPCHADDL